MFEITGQTAAIAFGPSHPLHGATVRVSLDMSLEDVIGMQERFEAAAEAAKVEGGDASSAPATMRREFGKFADDVLIDWDLAKKGEAVPANGAGMLSLPMRTAMLVMRGYFKAVMEVDKSDDE